MNRYATPFAPFIPVLVLVVVSGLSVLLLLSMRRQSEESLRTFIILVDGVHEARNSVTHAILLHEKGSAGSETVDPQVVLRLFDQAADELASIVGGESHLTSLEGTPLMDTDIRAMVDEYATAIRAVRDAIEAGYGSPGERPARDLGAERRVVAGVDDRAAQLIGLVNAELALARQRNRESFLLTLASWVMLLAGGSIGTLILVRRRLETERRLAVQAYFLENTNDAIIATDDEGRIVNWNKGAERTYGWTAEEVIGKEIGEVLNPVHDERSGEVEHRHKEGRMVPIETSVSRLAGFRPGKRLTVMVNRDVTYRRMAEETVRRHAELIDLTEEAMMVRDRDDRILFWNRGAERMYGWTEAEVLNKRACDMIVGENDREAFAEGIRETIEKGRWEAEMEQVRKDGMRMVVHCRWTLLNHWQGHSDVRLVVNTDITERRRLEARFERVAKLESLGSLAGGIVHDLNNILSPIILGVELLQSVIKDQKVASTLDMMSRSLERGRQIVKQVLTYVRGEGDGGRAVSVGQVLQELGEIVGATFPKSIRYKVHCPSGLRNTVGDMTQLGQVFMNLAVNARDAMPNGGELRVEVENVTIGEAERDAALKGKPGEYVCVTFIDTGTGIPAEDLAKIFEPFYTTKEVGKGTGLGLSTSLEAVKSSGGFIGVESEVGKGTKFRVYLRAVGDAGGRPGSAEKVVVSTEARGRVLVVEDETYVRSITAEILKTYGMDVIEAANGEEGLAVFRKLGADIDVVITDSDMPMMGGRQLIEEVRRLRPGVAIILASGTADAGAVPSGVQYLPKPYTVPQLRKALDLALGGKG